jgi:hypothetical protein
VQLEQDPILAGPWHQLFKQVQSPRHVVSELLQNADDAGATMASANIKDGEFIFTHNGEDFTEEHFTSLCRFGYSNKRSLHTIGFRGIGFKSTFSLGDQVRLVTPTLSVAFNRERFTEPVWVGETGQSSLTSIRVAIKDKHRQGELEKNLSEWLRSPASLLFFRHIRNLASVTKRSRLSIGAGPIADSEWMSLSSSPDKKYLLIRSQREEFPAEALEEIKQERMVSVSEESSFPPCRVEIVLGMEGRLFVILPTGVTTNLPFACNAPFVQDPARLKIKDPDISPTNRWLLSRAGELAAHAMMAWVSTDKLDVERRPQAYRLLSDVDREDSSLEGSCAAIVEQAIDDNIRGSKFLIAETGDLVLLGECQAVPDLLLSIWSTISGDMFFTDHKCTILLGCISIEDRQKLIIGGADQVRRKYQMLIAVLESQAFASSPNTWRQLMMLWAYLIQRSDRPPILSHHTAEDCAVQGRDILFAADEVVRLGEKKLLHSDEDLNFLAEDYCS